MSVGVDPRTARLPGLNAGVAETSVVVLGQIARDLAVLVQDVPEAGNSVDVERRRELLGGTGANIAVGLAQPGVPVTLIGVTGDDLAGEQLLAQCVRHGIDTEAVARRTGTEESALMVDVVTADCQWRYLESVPQADDHARRRLLDAATVLRCDQPARPS